MQRKELASIDPLWFKDAVIYELHVRAFHDSDADGVGDFRGLAEKLDYLQDLGVTALWLLPFCPSPWRDDGYDISDYDAVHPAFGTLRDFQSVLRQAHERGLKVITELVLNHTSDQHPWFQRARRARPGSRWRDFYVWSDRADRFSDARIIFKDFESSNWAWDPVAKAYYWHRFYSHQPDLNYDNPEVRRAMLAAVDFWFDLGVDGLRLDAVPYLYEREGTSCENLPETHQFLRELRSHVDGNYGGRMLLAEANQWPEDAVAYFGSGNECHMAFHFPLMPRLFMAQRREDRYPIVDILEQTPPIPDSCQWALFLRNHDELTLEMVTDEERDFMYRVYAHDPKMRINLGIRRRLAPLLGNNRRRNELMHGLLFSLPGTPIIYYGDEIGMGDNIYLGDRNGVRTPMQWSIDRNAGFSRANPQQLYLPIVIDPEYHYEAVNVEAEQGNPHSLLWWMKRLIALRKRSPALSRGTLQILHPENHRVLAFLRTLGEERVLVVANLSRFPQPVSLDLRPFAGMTPVEMFGGVEFPPVRDGEYGLSLAPHGFLWFRLEPLPSAGADARPPAVELESLPRSGLADLSQPAVENLLFAFLRGRLGRRSAALRSAGLLDLFPIGADAALAVLRVEFTDAEPDILLLPVATAFAAPPDARDGGLTLSTGAGDTCFLYDALASPDFCARLAGIFLERRRLRGTQGDLVPVVEKDSGIAADSSVGACARRKEVGGRTVVCDEGWVMRISRGMEPGPSVDAEVSRHLRHGGGFEFLPALAGSIEYRPRQGEPMTAAVVHRFVPNNGTAWAHTIDALGRFFERALAHGTWADPLPAEPAWQTRGREAAPAVRDLIGNYMEDARLLGERTAGMHSALAAPTGDPEFAPEPFSEFYRLGLYHALIGNVARTLQALKRVVRALPDTARDKATRVLAVEPKIREVFRPLRSRKITALRTRIHGDYRLERILWTGVDFVIFGFEGEPGRSKADRRAKRSALRDVAGMLVSLHHAGAAAGFGRVPGVISDEASRAALDRWGRFWRYWVEVAFFHGYFEAAADAPFLPRAREETGVLLDVFRMERALAELREAADRGTEDLAVSLASVLELSETFRPWA